MRRNDPTTMTAAETAIRDALLELEKLDLAGDVRLERAHVAIQQAGNKVSDYFDELERKAAESVPEAL